MKVIIPVAGKGTRLRPHTHITPKPMLKIAGKPVIDYVMDDLKRLGGVEEVIYITGHLKESFEKYARAAESLQKPSSAARAVMAGAPIIERVDRLVQLIARQRDMSLPAIDRIVATVDAALARNRVEVA